MRAPGSVDFSVFPSADDADSDSSVFYGVVFLASFHFRLSARVYPFKFRRAFSHERAQFLPVAPPVASASF